MRFFTFTLILFLSTTTHSQGQKSGECLGGDPNANFYVKNLNSRIQESRNLDQNIQKLYEDIADHRKQIHQLEEPLFQSLQKAAKEKDNNDTVRRKLLENYNPNDPKQVIPFAIVNRVFSESEFAKDHDVKNIQSSIKVQMQEIVDLQKRIKKLEHERDFGPNRMIKKWLDERDAQGKSSESSTCVSCAQDNQLKAAKDLREMLQHVQPPHISQACIDASIANKNAGSNNQVQCNKAQDTGKVGPGDLCVTKEMSDYVHWALNKAIDCLGSGSHRIDPNILELKLNNESTFRFFYNYTGGHGIMQTIKCSEEEMLGRSPSKYCGVSSNYGIMRSSGRKFLAKVMNDNPSKCEIYNGIIDFKQEARLDAKASLLTSLKNIYSATSSDIGDLKKTLANNPSMVSALDHYPHFSNEDKNKLVNFYKKENNLFNKEKGKYPTYDNKLFDPNQANNCQFISLEEGIHRNILTGLGLFLYYRDGLYDGDAGSAKDVLKNLGITPGQSDDYEKKLNYTALAMYGSDGDNGAAQKILSHSNDLLTRNNRGIVVGTAKDLTAEQFFNALKKIMNPHDGSGDPGYIGSVDKSKKETFQNKDVQCAEYSN